MLGGSFQRELWWEWEKGDPAAGSGSSQSQQGLAEDGKGPNSGKIHWKHVFFQGNLSMIALKPRIPENYMFEGCKHSQIPPNPKNATSGGFNVPRSLIFPKTLHLEDAEVQGPLGKEHGAKSSWELWLEGKRGTQQLDPAHPSPSHAWLRMGKGQIRGKSIGNMFFPGKFEHDLNLNVVFPKKPCLEDANIPISLIFPKKPLLEDSNIPIFRSIWRIPTFMYPSCSQKCPIWRRQTHPRKSWEGALSQIQLAIGGKAPLQRNGIRKSSREWDEKEIWGDAAHGKLGMLRRTPFPHPISSGKANPFPPPGSDPGFRRGFHPFSLSRECNQGQWALPALPFRCHLGSFHSHCSNNPNLICREPAPTSFGTSLGSVSSISLSQLCHRSRQIPCWKTPKSKLDLPPPWSPGMGDPKSILGCTRFPLSRPGFILWDPLG